MTVFDRIYNAALLPQIKTGSADDAVLAAKALLSGGVDAMELICRSDDEAAAIAAVQEQCPDMLVGAQCATWEACEKAAESGAQFLTTPGYSEKIVAWCDERGIPVIPGCVTPSEIMAATVQGVRIVKFFPAGAFGGMKTLASLAEVSTTKISRIMSKRRSCRQSAAAGSARRAISRRAASRLSPSAARRRAPSSSALRSAMSA